ncbi:hypothetical protein [Sphingorhabdus sp. M41]|uniref:hypothetical protein n=1 Tax=Sphingorhabdus sp. M41 TaxID=1806885 RepID=UPI00078EAAFC|nr:hypothetical protein [Sphingorhabdus sp. M41]AMO72726.1 hypothetical protein AZE99_13505 [Sphingorhabdus sp. M41]
MSRQVFLILLLIPSAVLSQSIEPSDRTHQLLDNARQLAAVDAEGCLLFRSTDEIVVCGTPEIDRQQRLPYPELTAEPGERIRELLPRANPGIIQQGRCYVTMNERNCFKGLSVLSVSFGGSGGGVGGAAGRIAQAVNPDLPDEDYVKQAMIRPLAPSSGD